MQASKIVPGQHMPYALKIFLSKAQLRSIAQHIVVRFHVTKVVTVQSRTTAKGSPHDYFSTVEGWVPAADLPPDANDQAIKIVESKEGLIAHFKVKPEQVLGLYTEHAELVERAKQEKADADAKYQADMARGQTVRLKLYELIGANEAPEESDEYRQKFRLSYGPSIDISKEGVEALYRALVEREVEPV